MMNLNKTTIAALLVLATIPLAGRTSHAETSPESSESTDSGEAPSSSESGESSEPTEVFPIPPDAAPFGKTMSEWAVDWWKWAIAIPKSISPIKNGDCTLGQTDPDVFFLAGNVGGASVRDCTIPANKKVFFPIVNVFVRQVPEFASTCSWLTTEEQLQQWAATEYDGGTVTVLHASLDGVPIAGPDEHRHHTAGFTFTPPTNPAEWLFSRLGPIAEGNACNLPAGPRLAVSDGFWLMLYSLEPGAHVLHFDGSVTYPDGYVFALDVTYNLTQE